MEKFEISINKELKEQMQKYDTNWSELCRKAIQDEINHLESNNSNINNLIDTDIDNISSVTKQSKIPELPRNVYKIFKEAWKELFGDSPERFVNHIAPPSSQSLKDWWKNWYNPNYWENLEHFEYPLDEDANFILSDFDCLNIQDNLVIECFHKSEDIDQDILLEHPEYSCFIYFISRFLFDGKILELNEIDPCLLESVEIDNRDNLPEESGIYFVRDKDNLYYIGMTKNLQERWYNHHRQDDFDKINNLKIAYLKGIPQYYLNSCETTLIEYFEPQLNIKNNPLLKR
jgi:hypothetical protein